METFCNKKGNLAKGCRYRMNRYTICVHCRFEHGNELCPQYYQNNRENIRISSLLAGSGQQIQHQETLLFDVYVPSGTSKTTGKYNYKPRVLTINNYINFDTHESSTPFGSANLEQLNKTIFILSTQNQTAINQLVETQIWQKSLYICDRSSGKMPIQCRLCSNSMFWQKG